MMTQEKVRELFEYVDGFLRWKVSRRKSGPDGFAGTVRPNGYRQVYIEGKCFRVHRLIFLYHHGYMPEQVDHKDLNRNNNKIENLREASNSQNNSNRLKRIDNTSGYKGVDFKKSAKKFRAQIEVRGRQIHLGYFDAPDAAARAYDVAAINYFGAFARLNFPNEDV